MLWIRGEVGLLFYKLEARLPQTCSVCCKLFALSACHCLSSEQGSVFMPKIKLREIPQLLLLNEFIQRVYC